MPSKYTTFVSVAQDLIKDAETRVKAGENAPTLLRDYKQRLECYCKPFFGTTAVHRIDARKLREFKQYLVGRGLTSSTILTVMSFVRSVLGLAVDDGIINSVPRLPVKGQKATPRPSFSRDQYQHLLKVLRKIESGKLAIDWKGNAIDWELRALVTFMVNSFTRPGDLFDLKHKHVTVVKGLTEATSYLRLEPPSSKDHEDPIITMPAAVFIYERLRAQYAKKGYGKSDDYVFLPARKNRDYAHEIVRQQFRLALSEAKLLTSPKGVDHTLYSLRHTAITLRLLLADNLDLLTLARTCRTSVEMIDRYYAKPLTAEMNRDKLFSFKTPPRRHLSGYGIAA